MSSVALIPARGGSKRIPRKNIKNFCGKPIIAYSIESALESGCFATTKDVINHFLEYLKETDDDYDYLCTIYATAPLLQKKYLVEGHNKLQNSNVVNVFSCTTMPFPIQRTFKLGHDDRCEMFWPENFSSRSQDLEEAYQDAGQFYWRNLKTTSTKNMFGSDSAGIVIPRHFVQDIDTLEDWERAEYMYQLINR